MMNGSDKLTYDNLLIEADRKNLVVLEKPLIANDGRLFKNRIAIRKDISTTKEKTCVLAEEIGHYETTVGNILNQRITENRKQEFQARMYAYNKLIGIQGLIDCYEYGCTNIHEMSEYLDVTERFVSDALEAYEQKYGTQIRHREYSVRFNPSLSIMKII